MMSETSITHRYGSRTGEAKAGEDMTEQRFPFADVFSLDDATGRLFWRNPPVNHAEKIGREAGYLCAGTGKNKSYWHVRAFGHTFKRSRVVFYMTHGYWPMPIVDHINGNSLDDRPENLRACSHSENTVNSPPKTRRYDLPRGVYLTKQGKYMARICVSQKQVSLGVFATVAAAAAAYEARRKEVFGEFAQH